MPGHGHFGYLPEEQERIENNLEGIHAELKLSSHQIHKLQLNILTSHSSRD